MSSNIRLTRQCHFCGKKFIAKTTVTKNCSDSCAKKAYKKKNKDIAISTSDFETSAKFEVAENNLSSKDYLSVKEACILYGISIRTIRRMIRHKKLPHLRFLKRIVLNKKQLEKILTF